MRWSILFLLLNSICFAAAQDAVEPNVPPAASLKRETSSDDRYQFADRFSKEVKVTMERTAEGTQFLWPDLSGDWDTALLSIHSWGAETEPWIQVSAGTQTIRQYLDANVLGLRWLNVTSLRTQLQKDAPIKVVAHAITLQPSQESVRVFQNKLDLSGRILILAPHPDDAEIAAFGLYAGRNATIVTVTSGNAGDMNYRANISDPAEHYLVKGYLRAVDSVTIPWQGQIPPDRTYNLGYFDAQLSTMYEAPDEIIPELYGPNQDVAPYRKANISKMLPNTSRTNTWKHLVEDLSEVLRKVKPSVIVMPHPWLDSHRDHQFASVALVQAMEKWNENPRFLLYTNHADANRYPYGTTESVVSLPPWSANEISVESIYSHALDSSLQLRKLFALESMHDLRLAPEEQNSCKQTDLPKRPDYPRIPEVDYLRRAPRPNELYFVYTSEGVKSVIRTFLEHRQQTP